MLFETAGGASWQHLLSSLTAGTWCPAHFPGCLAGFEGLPVGACRRQPLLQPPSNHPAALQPPNVPFPQADAAELKTLMGLGNKEAAEIENDVKQAAYK